MTRLRMLIAVAIVTLFGGIVFSRTAMAQTFRSGTSTNVAPGETIDSSVYMSGRSIDMAGTVNGDLYCAGQSVTISGRVRGDVLCAGQTVNISGTVDGDVRAAGQDVTISSKIAKNLTVGTQNFTLSSEASVGGDITGGASGATINGRVGRDLLLGAQTVDLNGQVARSVTGTVDQLTIGNKAQVGGDIQYTSKNEVNRAAGAQVTGTVSRTEPKADKNVREPYFAARAYWFLAAVFAAFLLSLLFPSVYVLAYDRSSASIWRTLVYGLLSFIAVPAAIVALMITVIGIPLAFLVMLLWLVVLLLSTTFAAFYVGRQIYRRQNNPLVIMLAGAIVLYLLINLPLIGGLVGFAAVVLGSGMIFAEALHRTPRPHYQSAPSLRAEKPHHDEKPRVEN